MLNYVPILLCGERKKSFRSRSLNHLFVDKDEQPHRKNADKKRNELWEETRNDHELPLKSGAYSDLAYLLRLYCKHLSKPSHFFNRVLLNFWFCKNGTRAKAAYADIIILQLGA